EVPDRLVVEVDNEVLVGGEQGADVPFAVQRLHAGARQVVDVQCGHAGEQGVPDRRVLGRRPLESHEVAGGGVEGGGDEHGPVPGQVDAERDVEGQVGAEEADAQPGQFEFVAVAYPGRGHG